jgi:RimJ/RimL family protein N-acetyltransferase
MDRHQLAHDSELESPQHRPARGNTGTVELGASSRLAVSSRSGHGRSGRYPGRLAAMSSGRGDAIEILRGNRVRLRRAELEEYEQVALPWYQDPEVLQLSEGGEAPYDRVQIRRMFEVLSGKGELYLIEVLEAAGWRAVGDAALIPEDVPIVIGSPQDRSRGIGTEVLQLLLLRARALGWTEIRATGIVPANYRSRQLLERAGFVEIPAAQGSDDAPIAMIKRLAP